MSERDKQLMIAVDLHRQWGCRSITVVEECPVCMGDGFVEIPEDGDVQNKICLFCQGVGRIEYRTR